MKWIFLLNSADTSLYFPKLKKTQFEEIKKTRKIKEEYLGRAPHGVIWQIAGGKRPYRAAIGRTALRICCGTETCGPRVCTTANSPRQRAVGACRDTRQSEPAIKQEMIKRQPDMWYLDIGKSSIKWRDDDDPLLMEV